MSKVLAYPDYHENDFIRFAEQTAINNILSDPDETKHYVIVPKDWFNQYFGGRKKGNFLIHFPGTNNKDEKARLLREEIDLDWYKTYNSEKARNDALNYFDLSRENQQFGGVFIYRQYKKTMLDHLITLRDNIKSLKNKLKLF